MSDRESETERDRVSERRKDIKEEGKEIMRKVNGKAKMRWKAGLREEQK